MQLNLVDLTLTVKTDRPHQFWQWLSASGVPLSTLFKHMVCHGSPRDCVACTTNHTCAWYQIFGQELAADPHALKRHQKPPLPFAFSPMETSATSEPGLLDVRLVLVGRAIIHLGLLLECFERWLNHHTAAGYLGQTVLVSCRDCQGQPLVLGRLGRITHPDHLVVLSNADIMESRPWDCDRLVVSFLSPLRLYQGGAALKQFLFGAFACSLLRRVSSMAYYYGDQGCDDDFAALSRQAEAIQCVSDQFHYGSRVGTERRMAGVEGSGCFQGEMGRLLPFLVIGSYVNCGKGAPYGSGSFRVAPFH